LIKGGLKLIAGRSENHLLLVDLTPIFGPGGGIFVQQALDRIGLTLNKNTIPTEPSSPFYPSGVRLGTPAMTTRGMKAKDMQFIGKKILETINEIKHYRLPADKEERKNYLLQFKKEIWCNRTLAQLRKQVRQYALCFPLP
jgi:glycine hydroxymethyltransferase